MGNTKVGMLEIVPNEEGVIPTPSWTEADGQRIARLREAGGLKQGFAARRLGIKQPTLSNWETGYRSPGMAVIPLAILYQTDPNTVLGWNGPDYTETKQESPRTEGTSDSHPSDPEEVDQTEDRGEVEFLRNLCRDQQKMIDRLLGQIERAQAVPPRSRDDAGGASSP